MSNEMKKEIHGNEDRVNQIAAVFTEILKSVFGENAPAVEVVLEEPQAEPETAEKVRSREKLERILEAECGIAQKRVEWLRMATSGSRDSEKDYMDTVYEELFHDLLGFAEMLECLSMILLLISGGKDCTEEDLTVVMEIMKQVCRDLEKWEDYQLLNC